MIFYASLTQASGPKGVLPRHKTSCAAAAAICLLLAALARGDEAAQPHWATFSDPLKSGGSGPLMIGVNGGRFRMGCVSGVACTNNEPVREVSITPFALSVYEITRGDFRRFVEKTGYVTDAERAPKHPSRFDLVTRGYVRGCLALKQIWELPLQDFTWENPNFLQTDQHPVVCVSWADAQAYVRWLAAETGKPYRLPSEAEWEYAARAGASGEELDEEAVQQLLYCASMRGSRRGPTLEDIKACLIAYPGTAAVGGQGPNAFGLYDMAGNAGEFVEDCWRPHFRGAPSDGTPWTKERCRERVVRTGELAPIGGAPFEARERLRRETRSMNYYGFRVALPTSY